MAVVNYRQSRSGLQADDANAVLHPAHTNDVAAAIEWLVAASGTHASGFHTRDLFLVGHSCGAHMAGLLSLCESGAASLLDPTLLSASSRALVRGCVGIEGIFDCTRFADDFPAWSQGIVDAFGPVRERWESPQDYLPRPTDETDSSPSRHRVQAALANSTHALRATVPWLVIHSPDDPWVNMPQASRFHSSLLARAASAIESTASTSSSSSLQPSQLLLVSGAHFEVMERVGTQQDELTAPIDEFVRRVIATRST